MNKYINQTIILPIAENQYYEIIQNPSNFRKCLDELIFQYPEIFPLNIQKGYSFVGWSKSSEKMKIPRRIIRLKKPFKRQDFLVHPCFVMPYLRGRTTAISKGLLLRKYNTPYHAIASTQGKNAMYWYRAELSLSNYNIVGTTVKSLDKMPKHLLIDEHHTRLGGDKIYLCSTVGGNCILGANLTIPLTYRALKIAYGVFLQEARQVFPFYAPLSINVDGYKSTKRAAIELYPDSVIIACFLHAFIKIRTNATSSFDDYFHQLCPRIWQCYWAKDKRSLAQKIRRIEEWTIDFVPSGLFQQAIFKLCKKKRFF